MLRCGVSVLKGYHHMIVTSSSHHESYISHVTRSDLTTHPHSEEHYEKIRSTETLDEDQLDIEAAKYNSIYLSNVSKSYTVAYPSERKLQHISY